VTAAETAATGMPLAASDRHGLRPPRQQPSVIAWTAVTVTLIGLMMLLDPVSRHSPTTGETPLWTTNPRLGPILTALIWGVGGARLVAVATRLNLSRALTTSAVLLALIATVRLTGESPVAGTVPLASGACLLGWRFAVRHETRDGFTGGLLLAAAVAATPLLWPVAFTIPAALGLYVRTTSTKPAHGRAVMAVLTYPTVVLLTSWAYLQWRFNTTVPWHRLMP